MALAGTTSSYQHQFSRFSSCSPDHPLARTAASFSQDGLAAVGGGKSAHGDTSDVADSVTPAASPAKVVAGCDVVVVGGAAGVLPSTASSGATIDINGATAAGVGVNIGGATAMRNHVGFAVRNDGTPGKIYLDLDGDISGVSFVHVSERLTEWGQGAGDS